MNNIYVIKLFKNMNNNYEQILSEINVFKDDVMKWADELLEASKNEMLVPSENTFQLPKTPSEKLREMKGRKKKKNTLLSNCSMISTNDECEMFDINDTISTRTRAAKRGYTSKMLSLKVANEKQEVSNVEAIKPPKVTESFVKEQISEATFVMPMGATKRTKPVIKEKLPDTVVPEKPNSPSPQNKKSVRNRSRSSSRSSSRKISATKSSEEKENNKNSPYLTVTPSPRVTRSTINRTLSKSPTERLSRGRPSKKVDSSTVERSSRRKASRTISSSPTERQSRRKKSRMSSPVDRFSKNIVPKSPSPIADSNISVNDETKRNSEVDKTLTIKREIPSNAALTFIVSQENENDGCLSGEEKTPLVKNGELLRLSKTSTPIVHKVEVSKKLSLNMSSQDILEDAVASDEPVKMIVDSDSTFAIGSETTVEGKEDDSVPKNKNKMKKDETCKENVEEAGETVRITRTKSKAIKKMMEENEAKQSELSTCAKKILNKAKLTSLKKNQLTTLLENNQMTPKTKPEASKVPIGTLKSKYHLLLSNSKAMKTPLATLPNNAVKIPKSSADKEKAKSANRDKSVETLTKTATKAGKDDALEKEMKLKTKKKQEEEAAIKRQNVIKTKQEELRRKNEMKHQLAMKQREKLEKEKYITMIQSEKEKEEKHKLILQERQMKLREEVLKKKILNQQKIAETNERRRLEEEARIARFKEQEAEEQRLALEKQKEQERQEKRAQERLAQKKAREEYEMQLKQEMEAERLKMEKMSAAKKPLQSASKFQSASKRPKFMLLTEKKEWDYKARDENDYGLEDEHSEYESDEGYEKKTKPPVPWAEELLNGKCIALRNITFEMMSEFIPCYQKTPNIHKMFSMTPTRQIKRNSSAIWSTPSS